jgi:hypothetical protein
MSYVGQVQFSRSIDDDIDPDYVYYNATIINNRTAGGYNRSQDPVLRFQETRDTPLVNDASKYNFSIIRFTMDGPNKDLPLFIPVIRTGAENPTNDVNLTIYSVSLTCAVNNTTGANPVVANFTATAPVIYTPETLDTTIAPVPLPSSIASGKQDLSSRYYWVYTYSWWLKLVNQAFTTALADIQTQFQNAWTTAGNAGLAPTLKSVAPYLLYNPTTNLFTLYSDAEGFGGALRLTAGTTSDESFQVYFNSNMFGMFANFNNTYLNQPTTELTNLIYTGAVGYGATTAGVPYAQNVVSLGAGASLKYFWTQVQDYESTSTLWSPIENVVFNSTLLPLVFEATGDPVYFGQSNDDTELTGSQSAFQPIITDVALPRQSASDYRGLIYYAPSAEYRLASFQRSKQAINNIDIQVFWRNRLDGNIYPVQMFNSSSVSVKIMFRRRGVNDYPHPAKGGVDV